MIDLNELRKNPEPYRVACTQKRIAFDIEAFLVLDEEYRRLKTDFESLRAKQNAVSKKIPKLKGEEKEKQLQEMKTLSDSLKQASAALKEAEAQWNQDQLRIPSPTLPEVPVGKDDTDNVEVKKWGDLPSFDFEMKDHVTLGNTLGLIDVERGVKIAGARSYFLIGDGARLQNAVLQFARDMLHRKGYLLMECPHIVKYEAMMGTSYFPGGEDSAYHLDERDSEFHLIGTSEVSVASFHANEFIAEERLPLRYAGHSPCYRREAGTYGKDTHGLYRVHQFYKVEQVVVCRNDPEESARMHEELLGNAEELMQQLELPYRVVLVCTGDIGQGQVKKHDIEAWMPSRESYGETHSCSTFYDFQSRRLKMRYKSESGKKHYCHTLNNTLAASPRLLIPLLENNQNPDGSVTIPEVLRPYMGGQERIAPPSASF